MVGKHHPTAALVHVVSKLNCDYSTTQKLTYTNGRTLFVSTSGLEDAKRLVSSYKSGDVQFMTPNLWRAKKIVDSTLHPGARSLDSLPVKKG